MAENISNVIHFSSHESDSLPAPKPAAQHIPEWLKQMPRDVTLTGSSPPVTSSSVKMCMPFVDAMSCGYVLPLAGDVRFTMRDANILEVQASDSAVLSQDQAQFPGAPFAGKIIVKFRNSWVIQTPPGYSTLFLPLLNQFHMPFHVLGGMVETDTFFMHVYFPSVCLMQPGEVFEMKKGAPIAQAIPIKRESWTGTHGPLDIERFKKLAEECEHNRHEYREKYWEKKNYR